MIDKVEFLDINGKKYPYFCGFNVLEAIQDKYGSIDKWMKKISGKEESGEKHEEETEEETEEEAGEISVADLKYTLALMFNEGADIEQTEILTEKEIGRLISGYGLKRSYAMVLEQVTICIYGKNAETTQEVKAEKKA